MGVLGTSCMNDDAASRARALAPSRARRAARARAAG
eukprot:COSAG06_NODE_19825_length_820_cov_3.380028_1_plen_35_part_01